MRLALFDFDGTITNRDTLFDFLYYTYGLLEFTWGILVLSPMLMLYIMKLIPNWKAKECVIRHFIKGQEVEHFEKVATRYSNQRLPLLIRKQALEKIEWHLSQGHQVAVVTASINQWVLPWCDRYGMKLIATHLESKNGRLTGRLDGANCQGPEKARRIKEAIDLNEFEYIYAYGNSRGDADMLALAHEKYYNWVKVVQ